MKFNTPYLSHDEVIIETFKKDPNYAVEYLNAVLKDGEQEELMLALRRVALAFGSKGENAFGLEKPH